MIRYILIVLLCSWYSSNCQVYLGEINLPRVHEDGFYRIEITPEITRYFNSDLANLRITDDTGSQVPYIIDVLDDHSSGMFMQYSILEKNQKAGCCTDLILENDRRDSINNLHLQIKNAEVTKQATLLASDDRENWYVLKEKFVLKAINNLTETSEIRLVEFPLSNYRYYRLKIDDTTSAPLNILSAGYFKTVVTSGRYSRISEHFLKRSDSVKGKRSYIHVKMDTLHVIDRLSVKVSGSPYFLREASVYKIELVPTKKKKLGERQTYLTNLELKNGGPDQWDMRAGKADHLLLVIENQDNPPLRIESVALFQLTKSLVTYLENGKRYKILIGDGKTPAPVYDLAHLKGQIKTSTLLFPEGGVTIYPKHKPTQAPTFFTAEMMWLAIIGIIVVLAVLSFKMIKDTAKSEANK